MKSRYIGPITGKYIRQVARGRDSAMQSISEANDLCVKGGEGGEGGREERKARGLSK